jgi:predicted NodU family carbamoyl transferase|tara:strand:- start:280 stop:1203 length:924 start_codon:yes stop_codon:yes gene_type:complete
MRKILGINISHNCSCAYFENNILKEYYEEDRFNKIKNYEPDASELCNYTYEYQMLKKFKNITFDVVVFASYDRGYLQIELPIIKHFLKQLNYKKYYFDINNHHIYHATCGYFFSKFDQAIALISDGGGETQIYPYFRALQSVFLINKKEVVPKYKYFSNKKTDYFNNFVSTEEHEKNKIDYVMSSKSKAGLKYLYYLYKSNFKAGEEGQMMGMAAYKNKQTDLDKNIINICNEAQEETLKDAIELMEKAKKYSNCKNIILSGGYHLNCSNNFKLVKHFPEYKFFVDPIPYDAGTAIGGVYYYENYLQ